jgi:hypothetical protein
MVRLVHSIYPLLARFVPTISDSSSRLDQQFTRKQECFRKSIERTFIVLKKKFLSLSSEMRFDNREEIFCIVKCAVVMHNMIVEEQTQYDEIENENEDNYIDHSVNLEETDSNE